MQLALDRFCLRQFVSGPLRAGGAAAIQMDPREFTGRVNELYAARVRDVGPDRALAAGYAPFCKHLFVPNFVGPSLRAAVVPVTDSNAALLRCRYEARAEHELPVLVRFFPADAVEAPPATFLDIILYSREQIRKENAATGQPDDPEHQQSPWGIISVKPQLVDFEQPMQPITLFRNALGKEHGGSGVPLDREKYLESVNFWQHHATVV